MKPQPLNPPPEPLSSEETLSRARGGLMWLLICLFLGWLTDSGFGVTEYLSALQQASREGGQTAAFMAIALSFLALFCAALGQIFGEELSAQLWAREQSLLLQSTGRQSETVWRQNLLADPFEWMVSVHGRLNRFWKMLPESIADCFESGGLFERLAALTRRALCLFAGVSGTFFMAGYMQIVGMDELMSGSEEHRWKLIAIVLLIGALYALAFTSLTPVALLLVVGLVLVYYGIIGMMAGELIVLKFFILLQGVFLLLVAVRGIRRQWNARAPGTDTGS